METSSKEAISSEALQLLTSGADSHTNGKSDRALGGDSRRTGKSNSSKRMRSDEKENPGLQEISRISSGIPGIPGIPKTGFQESLSSMRPQLQQDTSSSQDGKRHVDGKQSFMDTFDPTKFALPSDDMSMAILSRDTHARLARIKQYTDQFTSPVKEEYFKKNTALLKKMFDTDKRHDKWSTLFAMGKLPKFLEKTVKIQLATEIKELELEILGNLRTAHMEAFKKMIQSQEALFKVYRQQFLQNEEATFKTLHMIFSRLGDSPAAGSWYARKELLEYRQELRFWQLKTGLQREISNKKKAEKQLETERAQEAMLENPRPTIQLLVSQTVEKKFTETFNKLNVSAFPQAPKMASAGGQKKQDSSKKKPKGVCFFFNKATGCKNGKKCGFKHVGTPPNNTPQDTTNPKKQPKNNKKKKKKEKDD